MNPIMVVGQRTMMKKGGGKAKKGASLRIPFRINLKLINYNLNQKNNLEGTVITTNERYFFYNLMRI